MLFSYRAVETSVDQIANVGETASALYASS
jgi:hypothetical protein